MVAEAKVVRRSPLIEAVCLEGGAKKALLDVGEAGAIIEGLACVGKHGSSRVRGLRCPSRRSNSNSTENSAAWETEGQ